MSMHRNSTTLLEMRAMRSNALKLDHYAKAVSCWLIEAGEAGLRT